MTSFSRVPDQAAGAGVDSDEMLIDGQMEDLVVKDRQAACVAVPLIAGQVPPILPDEVTGARVQGLDDVPGIGQVHHAIVHQRRSVLTPALHGTGPGQAQLADIALVDLIQRAVGPRGVRTSRHQPLARWWIPKHLLGDGDEILDLTLGEMLERHRPHVFSAQRAHEGHERGKVRAADVGTGRHLPGPVLHQAGDGAVGAQVHDVRLTQVSRTDG